MSKIIERTDLFTMSATQRVLAFLAQNPDKEYYDSEIFREMNELSRAAVNNALRALADNGLTERIIKGRIAFNRIKEDLPEIKYFKILLNTQRVRKIIEPAADLVKKVILYGSSAQGENRSDSDLDIFIVTDKPDLVRKSSSKKAATREEEPDEEEDPEDDETYQDLEGDVEGSASAFTEDAAEEEPEPVLTYEEDSSAVELEPEPIMMSQGAMDTPAIGVNQTAVNSDEQTRLTVIKYLSRF